MDRHNEALIQAARLVPRVWTALVLNDNYRIGSLIEQGATFELYDGTQISTNDRVCLKVLLPQLAADPKVLALFLEEGRILSRVSHAGLLQYRASARDPQSDLAYIVMDFPGPRLSARVGVLKAEPRDILAFGKQLASALAVAHRAGFVHGHLTPESVVLPGDGLTDAAIIGFSLIKAEMGASQLGTAGGADTVGPWTDIRSLALVMVAASGGKHRDRDVSVLPRKLRPVVVKMLRAGPRGRLRRMDDVVDLLHRVVLDSEPRQASAMVQPGRSRFAKMSDVAGAAARGGLAAAALLIAASPWLLQTGLPQAPAKARAASVAAQVQLPAPAKPSAEPALSDSDASTLLPERVDGADDTAARAGVGKTRRQAPDQTNMVKTASPSDATLNEEAELTARLNANQMRTAARSREQAAAEIKTTEVSHAQEEATSSDPVDRAPLETGAVDPPAAAQQIIDQSPAAEPEPVPQLVARDAARPAEQDRRAVAAASTPVTEQAAAAREAEARSKATADRKLREWCKAQRRRCTFPTQP